MANLITKMLNKIKPASNPGNATLRPIKYETTVIVRRKDGSLKAKREMVNGKETKKEDY